MSKSGISRGTNPAGVGAGIASERLKNSVAIPNQNDVNAKMFKDLSGSFGAKSGDRPRGAWRNAASGFFSGLEHAENSKSTAKKTEKAEQYDKVMEYLQEVNNSTIERNEWFEKQEYARKQALPSVLAYMNNIDKLDPQSQFLMAQNILSQYSSATGEPLKLVSIGGSNPNMVTVEGEKGVSVLDLSTLFAGNDALEEQIAHKSVDYQLAVQEKRANNEREFALKEEKNQIAREKLNKGIPDNGEEIGQETFEFNGQNFDIVPLAGLEKGEKTDYGKSVNKAISQIGVNENALGSIKTMREIFARNPNIGESFVNMLSSGDDEDTWGRWIAKHNPLVSRQERADMEILKKAAGDLNLSTVLSVPGKSATDLLKQTIRSAAPTGTLTKQAFDKISDEWEARSLSNIEMARAQAQARAQGKMIISRSVAKNTQGEESDWDKIWTASQ